MTEPTLPPRVPPKVKSAPKPRQVYWCELPKDAQLPEFWKRRPVVILSANANLYGCAVVIPLSSKAQPDNPWAHAFPSPLPGEKIAWAVCSHIMTIAVSRLVPPDRVIPRISDADFLAILTLAHKTIPTPRAGH
jgi:mRNA interferase MazF